MRTRTSGTGAPGRIQGVLAAELPFFVQYNDDDGGPSERRRQGYHAAASPAQRAGFSWIEVGGDRARLDEWLGDYDLPVRVIDGPAGLRGVGISSPRGEIVIRNA